MRRDEQEIKSRKEIEAVILQAQVCRVGFSENDIPYIVPMNFGYADNCLYFHCAREGRKLDIMRKNNKVCFEMDVDFQMVKPAGRPCGWSARYRSVMGTGKAFVISDQKEKSDALNIVTGHYGGDIYEFSETQLQKLEIIKIEISEMTGKKA